MCVASTRTSLLARSGFLGAVGAAALPLLASAAADAAPAAPLVVPTGLSAANARAARIAARSPLVRSLHMQIVALAGSVGDATLRADVVDLLARPRASYQAMYPTSQSRVALRDALAREGFIAADAPVAGLFPPVGADGIAQPFWSTPGSDTNGHHSYPGGLCAHELFNARMGMQFAQTYDRQYFGGRANVDPDVAIAAALYHDIMKTVVFQYREDGTFLEELSIGDTGGHHCLSGAEAILRGRDARFVTVLLSAHAAPSLGDERKVVTWARAAAMIAGVDPVAFGLVKRTPDGFGLAALPPVEAFVNHLSDHDYVLTIQAAHHVRPALAAIAPSLGIAAAETNWWRLRACSEHSEIALYEALTRGGDAFKVLLTRESS
ncbi:MAG TPA: HDIG domain-containing metalloprotein [Candidatus Aquilonibacter sp.]